MEDQVLIKFIKYPVFHLEMSDYISKTFVNQSCSCWL